MYSVYADDVCIYNDSFMLEDAIIIEPVLTLEANAAGSFELTLPPTNKAYATIDRLKTLISVKRESIINGEKVKNKIWEGRVISDSKDYWNNRKLVCEGELAFLNDTSQPMVEYHEGYRDVVEYPAPDRTPTKKRYNIGTTVYTFLKALLDNHNHSVWAFQGIMDKQFEVGNVTADGFSGTTPLCRYTNYEKTIECINEKLVDKLGGYLMIRNNGIHRYLDYLAEEDLPNTSHQTIDFKKNLIDFVRSWNSEEFATVILPLGARQETSPIEALEDYLTVAGATDPDNVILDNIYVQNEELVNQFGRIVKVVHWDDVTTADVLLNKARAYLSSQMFNSMTIEVSALDLNYIDPEIQPISLYDKIRVKSAPHGLANGIDMLVTKLEIPLDSPENTVFTLGTKTETTLTETNNIASAAVRGKIEDQRSSILDEASTMMDSKTISVNADVDYIAMMSGIDLDD